MILARGWKHFFLLCELLILRIFLNVVVSLVLLVLIKQAQISMLGAVLQTGSKVSVTRSSTDKDSSVRVCVRGRCCHTSRHGPLSPFT